MALHIRLARFGRTHRPYYRIVAIDSRNHREGKAKEILGTYDPLKADQNVEVTLERVHYWVSQGAQLSVSVRTLLAKFGYAPEPEEVVTSRAQTRLKRRAARKTAKKKDGTKWVAPSRRALRKHAKAVREAAKQERELALAAHKKAQEEAAGAESEAEAETSEG
jgi:small subunit ribosomal protein S16